MDKLTIIGDVHGKLQKYKEITDRCENSICVGDFGFKDEWDWHADTKLYNNHLINGGNHDYGPYLKNGISSTGDFRFFADWNLFTVRGALSIDRHLRTTDVDWFENEELSYHEQLAAYDEYCNVKPHIVISHDCPQIVMENWFGYTEKSQTRTMLQYMFEVFQPEIWIFGHHHKSKNGMIENTKFICLNELETINLEI